MQFDTGEQALQADLLWAAVSPDLMQVNDSARAVGLRSIADAPVISALTDWIQNNHHQTPLAELITERQPRRLGIYYEVLWQYILENFPGFQLVARNLPIIDGKRTLGELDFVYYCQQRQRFVHLETAVKFYLGIAKPILPDNTQQPQLSWSQWLGPGRKDRLDLKLLKMFNQQSCVSHTPQGKQTLAKLDVEQPLREICLKGYFFYPLQQPSQPPINCYPQHGRGYWLKLADMGMLENYIDCWQIMAKEQWLSPLFNHDDQQRLKLNDLKIQLAAQLTLNPFPIMIANMQTGDNGSREKARFFITPDNWPGF